MKTSHAWSLIVAFAVVLCVGLAAPAAARTQVTAALPEAGSGDSATLSPALPPIGEHGDLGPVQGDDPDGDPDDIMGGNNATKGPMVPTSEQGPTFKVTVSRTLSMLLRAWMSLRLAR
jgi:hypothetical protein